MARRSERFRVITWQRGNHGIVDTKYEIGDPRRREGRGFNRRRDAEAYARRLNRETPLDDDGSGVVS